ncbi:hypothetical protein Drorol1_Dr00020657 [Drosera rotundifolia]
MVPPAAPDGLTTWAFAEEVAQAARATLLADFGATDTEKDVMSDIIMCAMGIPALQGAHLMATGHRYLSAAGEKSRQMYAVVEKQFWKKNPTKDWVEDIQEDIKDALWHKAGHPINMTISTEWRWTLLSHSNLGRPWLFRLHPVFP